MTLLTHFGHRLKGGAAMHNGPLVPAWWGNPGHVRCALRKLFLRRHLLVCADVLIDHFEVGAPGNAAEQP